MHKSISETHKYMENTTTVTITVSSKCTTYQVDELEKYSFTMTMKEAQRLRDILNEAVRDGLL